MANPKYRVYDDAFNAAITGLCATGGYDWVNVGDDAHRIAMEAAKSQDKRMSELKEVIGDE